MNVLKPEVYWIGNRCYRINPCPTSQNQYVTYDTKNDDCLTNTNVEVHKPYIEANEFEDSPMNIDEENSELHTEAIDVIREENGFKVVCNVPSSLYSHIIGSKGAVKKRLEIETRTRIYVPRQNEKGDIVIRGQLERDVRKGHKRIMQIAQNARFKREVTHFACFPMNDAAIVQKAREFKEKVLKECENSSRGLDKNIFQEPEKLHLTISVLVLLDARERQAASEVLSNVEEEIKERLKGKGKLRMLLKGLEIMNDDPTQVDVLYAKCEPVHKVEENEIQNIADIIARKFIEKGLGKEIKGEKVKLHCTLMNSKYRSDVTKSEGVEENRRPDDRKRNNGYSPRESFDARPILKNFGGYEFGTVDLSEVKLATRHTTANDGFYKCYTAISL